MGTGEESDMRPLTLGAAERSIDSAFGFKGMELFVVQMADTDISLFPLHGPLDSR